MKLSSTPLLFCVFICLAGAAQAADIAADWSDAQNPNGDWAYLEGANPLPAVASWEAGTGNFGTAQPGWSEAQNANNRLPFWFRYNGTANFALDLAAGDVGVHSTDAANGVGNGDAAVTWTCPAAGVYDLQLRIWIARDIGRSVNWVLDLNGTGMGSGTVASGDAFSRANPSGVSAHNLELEIGDVVQLRLPTASASGDFVGVRLSIAEPSAAEGWEFYE